MNPTESFDLERQRMRDERQYQQREQMRCLEKWSRTKSDKGVEDEVYYQDVELMDHLRSLMRKNPEPKSYLKAGPSSNCKNGTSTRIGRAGSKRHRKRHRDFGDLSLIEREKLQRPTRIRGGPSAWPMASPPDHGISRPTRTSPRSSRSRPS